MFQYIKNNLVQILLGVVMVNGFIWWFMNLLKMDILGKMWNIQTLDHYKINFKKKRIKYESVCDSRAGADFLLCKH